jgi:carbon starvation protein
LKSDRHPAGLYDLQKRGQCLTWSIIAVTVMYLTVIWGAYMPIKMPPVAGIPGNGVWVIVLLIYAFIASTLPVTTLLQPRDFINSHQLLIAMALIILGVAGLRSFSGQLQHRGPGGAVDSRKRPPP